MMLKLIKSFWSPVAIALAISLNLGFVSAETEPPSETKTALINELRVLTFRDENATQMLDLMIQQIQDQSTSLGSGFFGEETDPEELALIQESVTRITDRLYTLMQEKIDFVALQREIDFMLYNEYFTEAELQDLIAFYKTPTGQKTAAIFPELTERSTALFSAQLTPAMMEITQQVMFEEFASSFEMLDDLDTWDPENLEAVEETE
ncbi:hypothetical protein AWQ21_09465 [Picosynechococcus sp. PCC 7003]|uniref:DUF2059 domain-containing protein n=1 Tax=Picosynechococcus sp. PCC 7003 TaxID=374981 RepID=UPI000810BC0C|nr:DUF2059 domain-containing protein [Picosynechococcus sp. PCC 7003]ANV84592.1 hypothetical protein AWQ21_09465 [Picosynechococcus sp. PCC 7003]